LDVSMHTAFGYQMHGEADHEDHVEPGRYGDRGCHGGCSGQDQDDRHQRSLAGVRPSAAFAWIAPLPGESPLAGRSGRPSAPDASAALRALVDTSAWVDFLTGHGSPEQAAVAELLRAEHDVCTCGIIAAEVFQGLRRDKGRDEIARLFREMTLLEATG